MYQAKSGVNNFSLYWGGGPSTKIFFPSLNMYRAKSGVKIFSFTRGGSLDKKFFPGLNMYQAKSGVKNFSLYWDRVPPLKIWNLGPPRKSETWDSPHPKNLRHGTPLPLSKAGSGTPPPWNVNRLKLLPSPILRMAGGNKKLLNTLRAYLLMYHVWECHWKD